ncbi:MAG: transcription termination/antitermination protein NusG [Porphyromonas sp.]|nr:transcription termination/antitermination protein NusG [Porphyromonas sp.]
MATTTEKRFYVLRAISGKESKVCEAIEMEMKNTPLGNYVSRVLIPTEKVMTQRNGKKYIKERPYLPGYVLVEASLVGDTEHILRNIPDVIGFLGTKNPEPLRQSEVNRILGKADQHSEEEGEFEVNYIVGETVKIIDGAFADFSAIIEEVMPDKKKLKVMVKIFGRKTPLELGYAQVVKE